MALRTRRPATLDAASVFINCPFDADYWPLLEVMVFTVIACGFNPRSALEESDSSVNRLEKIQKLIGQAAFGIHDISRVKVSGPRGLPRFNMPFELGLDIGCKRHGSAAQRSKKLLVLDKLPYRYQKCLSDIAGQDIKAHGENVNKVMTVVRDWLRMASGRTELPGPDRIKRDFRRFSIALPGMCAAAGLRRGMLPFVEYVALVREALSVANEGT